MRPTRIDPTLLARIRLKAFANPAGLAMCVLVTGCGTPRSYMGLDLRGLDKAPPVHRLAAVAAGGDKGAQLMLGRAFESGDGVPQDFERACQLYERAAAATGGTMWIYQPKIGNLPGRVMPITTPASPGEPEARTRLDALVYRASGAAAARGCLARHR